MFAILLLISQVSLSLSRISSCGCEFSRSSNGVTANKKVLFYENNSNEQCLTDNSIVANKDNYLKYVEGMVLVPKGEYQYGTDDIVIENDNEGPSKLVNLSAFYLDKYEVTNKNFEEFVYSSSYKTEAENFGDSFVFGLFLNNTSKEKLKDFRVLQAPWWYKVSGADWRHPDGPDSNVLERMDHPVVHVSWRDARAYCAWRGARLPRESEWEAACRGGKRGTSYPWGDKLLPGKVHMANIWQGTFPNYNSAKDGYVGTNPVSSFPQNEFGLHNIAGNVWEWTEDSWNSKTPAEKVKKGGSYLCHRSYCFRYRCSARSHNTEDSSACNLGFRCARDL